MTGEKLNHRRNYYQNDECCFVVFDLNLSNIVEMIDLKHFFETLHWTGHCIALFVVYYCCSVGSGDFSSPNYSMLMGTATGEAFVETVKYHTDPNTNIEDRWAPDLFASQVFHCHSPKIFEKLPCFYGDFRKKEVFLLRVYFESKKKADRFHYAYLVSFSSKRLIIWW